MTKDQAAFDKALAVGRPPNIVRLFPNSRALLVSGKAVDRAMRAKGQAMTIAANCRNGFVLPDGFNPVTIGFTIGHDVSLSNWDTLLNLSRTQTLVGYKSVKPNGAVTYAYGYFIMSEVVKQSSGAVDFVDASFFAQGRTISYA